VSVESLTGDAEELPETSDRLRRIEALTDGALAHLAPNDLLVELLGRVRQVLEVDTAAALVISPDRRYLVPIVAIGIEEEIRQGIRIPIGRGFAGGIVADGRPRAISRVDRTTVYNPVLWEAGIQSMLGVPMVNQGDILGVLHVGTLRPREFTEDDERLLQVVADRVALATQARHAEEDRAAAAALQRSLLPSELPQLDGVELAGRYVPGAAGVGGDWYDVFGLPSGELGIVMGDVVGRGLGAAVIMGRFRSALRAYALEFDDPAVVLGKLDRKAQHFEPDILATVAYGILDPVTFRFRMSSAGHPPPILAVPGELPTFLDVSGDLPIGVREGARRTTVEVDIEPGAVLAMYTDGLIESREQPLEKGLEILREAIAVGPAEDVCATVFAKLVGLAATKDDIALVVLRRS
jgi:serine phosphatase RsbU (regulator of sigma subunit)